MVLSDENQKFVKKVNTMVKESDLSMEDLSKRYQKLMEKEAEDKDNFHSKVKEKEWEHGAWTIELQELFDQQILIEIQKYKKLKKDQE